MVWHGIALYGVVVLSLNLPPFWWVEMNDLMYFSADSLVELWFSARVGVLCRGYMAALA